jgi:hypothetical protein
MPETMHSYHIFLLPFKWDAEKGQDWEESLKSLLGEKWKPDRFSLTEKGDDWYTAEKRFNEYVYFHDFCREILYDFDQDFRKPANGTAFMRHYETAETPEFFEIRTAKDGTFRLKVNSILANFYWMGVGVLSLHLENHNHPSAEEVLKINEYGRRIYPPFLPLAASQGDLLAREIGFPGGPMEDFQAFQGEPFSFEDHDKAPLPKYLSALFPQGMASKITPLSDDRMFVQCIYQNGEEAEKAKLLIGEGREADRIKDDFIGKFIHVDGSSLNCNDPKTFDKTLKDQLYTRWSQEGTVFGISRYSFVCLLKPESPDFIWAHFRTMYYKLVELSLVQRASVLVFQEKVSRVSGAEPGTVSQEVRDLYNDYLRFVNKVYFLEVTAQEQGIELYDLLQNRMRIGNQVENLQNEMRELHEYASMVSEERRNDRLDLLTRIGAAFIAPSFMVGFLGMNMFEAKSAAQDQVNDPIGSDWVMKMVVLFAIMAVPALMLILVGRKKKIGMWVFWVVGLVMAAVLLGLSTFYLK